MKLTNHLNWSRVLDDEQRKPENRIRAYKLRQNLPRIINRRSSPEPKMSKAYCGYLSQAIHRLEETEKNIEANPKQRIKIDGGYGDLSMSIFRKKDRNRRLNDIPVLFTEEFKSRLNSYFPDNTDSRQRQMVKLRRLIEDIIKRNQQIRPPPAQSASLEQSRSVQRSYMHDYEVDLDGHLNYNYSSTYERQWMDRLRASYQKSMEMRAVESHPRGQLNQSKNSRHLLPRHHGKDYMFKSLALNRFQ